MTMQLVRGLHNLTSVPTGCVLTIGNFDGVHRGHQAVLARLQQQAQKLNLPATLMIFEPHPKEFLHPASAPARLTNLTEKLTLLKNYPIDRVVLIKFNFSFAQISADKFIQQLLIKRLGVQYLLTGEDFHFGKNRQGNLALLQAAGKQHGFITDTAATITENNMKISSTQIRHALTAGDFVHAKLLLGYDYSMIGHVQYGDQRGRQLGFPTANIPIGRKQSPIKGVFAIKADIPQLGYFGLPGIANLGNRPSVDGSKMLLEVHLFKFTANLYSKKIRVRFIQKIRDEKKFGDISALSSQIKTDVAAATEILTLPSSN